MSRYTGPQQRGAERQVRVEKRREAEAEPEPRTVIDRATSNAFTCPGKIRYLERKYAKRAAKQILRQHGDKMSAYRCTACGLWHLGHMPVQWR